MRAGAPLPTKRSSPTTRKILNNALRRIGARFAQDGRARFRWLGGLMTTVFSTANSTALELLRGSQPNKSTQPQVSPWAQSATLGPDPIDRVAKEAAAKIAAIVVAVDEDGANVDLSSAGTSNVAVFARNYATITTGDGDDWVDAYDYATVTTNGGNDGIEVYDYGKVSSGAGDDVISTYGYARIDAGDGDDVVHTGVHSVVDAGEGDDWVRAYGYAAVDGGAGNDEIRTYDYSTVDAGDGDDLIITLGNSTIRGGAGDDTLIVTDNGSEDGSTFDHASVDGGEGDDYIQVNRYSTVTGGTGNDTIRLLGDGNTVLFNRGDGQDVIGIGIGRGDSATIRIAGYGAGDVTVTYGSDRVTVAFKESDDLLTLQFAKGAAARLEFDDGSTLDIVPPDAISTAMQRMHASADAQFGQARPILHF